MDTSVELAQKAELITKEQLYKLLHISKRKAKYLLDNGIIPCVDSGKKTRKYTIKMSDVRAFISSSEPLAFPRGIFNSTSCKRKEQFIITDRKALRKYYERLLQKHSDVLSVHDISDISGYTKQTIYQWMRKGFLSPIRYGCSFLVSKRELIDFFSSKTYNAITQKSQKHLCELEKIAEKERQV